MPDKNDYKLDEQTIQAIESVLRRGDRAEIVPLRDGVKVLHIKREEVKNKS